MKVKEEDLILEQNPKLIFLNATKMSMIMTSVFGPSTWLKKQQHGTYNGRSEWDVTCVGRRKKNKKTTTTLSKQKENNMDDFGKDLHLLVPDIRNGMKILSPVSGWMMAWDDIMTVWHHHPVIGPMRFERLYHLALTCLTFWASHNFTRNGA